MLQRTMLLLVVFATIALLHAGNIALVQQNRGGVELKWTLQNVQIQTAGEYTVVEFDGGCGLYAVGRANLPSQQTFVEIPLDSTPLIRVTPVVVEKVMVQKPVVPAQEPEIDTVGAEKILRRDLIIDREFYQSRTMFPGNVAEVAYQGIMRGRNLVLLRINPIQYIPQTGELFIYKECTINVDFIGGIRSIAETDTAMDPIASALVLNYAPGKVTREDGSVDYLIITVSALSQIADEFAAWKSQKGLVTKVEIVANNPSVGTMKELIRKYYPGLKYVLILADHPQIALPLTAGRHPLGTERCQQLGLPDGTVPSDLYYACLEGTDYYPDIYIGRVPANTVPEAQILIGKIIDYQSKPVRGDWLKRFLLCGEFQYQSAATNTAERLFCETAFTIWNSLKTKYEFPSKTIGAGSSGLGHAEYFFRKSVDENDPTKPGTYRAKIRDAEEPVVKCKMPAEWYPNIVSDATAKANTLAYWRDGVFLVQHRDHGGETGWGKPSVNATDVANLSNGKMQPILFSVNCLTGAMDYSKDCFVEAALKNPNGGAASAIGSTRVSYSWWNDRLCDGFYTCLYGTKIYDCLDKDVIIPDKPPLSRKLGIVLNFGKMYLARNYPSNPWGTSYDYTEIEFYLFHCIGDPEMDIWVGPLTDLDVQINDGQIQVLDQAQRTPITAAQVCIYGENTQIVVQTDEKGQCSIPSGLKGNFTVTITGDQLYPYQQTLEVK